MRMANASTVNRILEEITERKKNDLYKRTVRKTGSRTKALNELQGFDSGITHNEENGALECEGETFHYKGATVSELKEWISGCYFEVDVA